MMKKILISSALALGVVLVIAAAAAFVPAETADAQPAPLGYSYPVKYICGPEAGDPGWAVMGEYRTEINIYNHNRSVDAGVEKFIIQLVKEGKAVGREPDVADVSATDGIGLGPMQGTMDDCERIARLLGAPWPLPALFIGYFDVVSQVPITVKAIYTVRTDRGISIDVEDVEGKERL